MQEHLSAEQIDGYRARALPVHETVAIDRHVSQCPACRKQLYKEQEIHASFLSLQISLKSISEEPEHLTYEEKKGFVHGKSDALERELVESHVAVCSQCKLELESFQRFVARLDAHPDAASAPSESMWQRVLGALRFTRSQSTMKWSGLAAAAILIVVVSSVAVLLSSRESGPASEIARQIELTPPQPNTVQRIEPVSPEVSPPPPSSAPPPSISIIQLSKAGDTPRSFPVSESAGVRIEVVRDPSESQRPNPDSDPNAVQRTANVRHYKEYRAMLRSTDGKMLDLGTAKAGKSGKVLFAMPRAGRLRSGEYQLILSGVTEYGEVETAGTYEFQVVKR